MQSNDRENVADRLLDAALKHHSSVEPRAGLDARVLANLRAEHGRLGSRVSLWVSLAAMAVLGVVAATIFMVRRPNVELRIVATRPATRAIAKEAITGFTELKRGSVRGRPHIFATERPHAIASAVSLGDNGPKLEQFPSPRPLSKQEEMLARYVQERPQEARLIARAQAELLQRDLLEFRKRGDLPETEDSTQ